MKEFPLDRLIAGFRGRFGSDLEYEREIVGGLERFSFFLVSPLFEGMPHLKRQDAVWDLVDSVLSRDEALHVSAVLPLAPGEIETLVK